MSSSPRLESNLSGTFVGQPPGFSTQNGVSNGVSLADLVPSLSPVPNPATHRVVPFPENGGISPFQTDDDAELSLDTPNQRDASTISFPQNFNRFRSHSAPDEIVLVNRSLHVPTESSVPVDLPQDEDEDGNVEPVLQPSARQEESTVYGRKKNWIAVGALVMVAVLWVFAILLAQGFFGPRLPYDIAVYMAAGALVLSLVPLTLFMARWYDDRPNATFVRA